MVSRMVFECDLCLKERPYNKVVGYQVARHFDGIEGADNKDADHHVCVFCITFLSRQIQSNENQSSTT